MSRRRFRCVVGPQADEVLVSSLEDAATAPEHKHYADLARSLRELLRHGPLSPEQRDRAVEARCRIAEERGSHE